MRWVAVCFALLVVVSCGDSPVAPTQSSRSSPCLPATLPDVSASVALAPSELSSALEDAASRMSSGLGDGASDRVVDDAIRIVANSIDASNYIGICEKITTAALALDALPDNPDTLPDRDGIRLVLALTARSISLRSL